MSERKNEAGGSKEDAGGPDDTEQGTTGAVTGGPTGGGAPPPAPPPAGPPGGPPGTPPAPKTTAPKKKTSGKTLAELIHEELEELECYHGMLLEEEVRVLLPRRGDFMMRLRLEPDGTKQCYATVNSNDQMVNVRLKPKAGAKKGEVSYAFDRRNRDDSIKDLLQRLQNGTAVVVEEDGPHYGSKVMLIHPIPKQSWELRRDSVDLLKKLGEGAFGEVHAGRLRRSMGRAINVAIKVIKKSANNEKATTELMKEGALMRKFSHPNVVRTFGMVIERDTIMVVMELINGGGLNDYVKKNKVTMEEKGGFALDIACGLAYIHSLNCIHRDIACRNCLIDIGKKQAKVSDFGLTRQTEVYKIQASERIPIRWIAPEVLKSYEYTRAADIYAYGILVWEIVANGATPYDMQNNQQIKEGVQAGKRPDMPPDTLPEISDTITKCWSGDAASRPQMEAVKKMLAKFRAVGSENESGFSAERVGGTIEKVGGSAEKGGSATAVNRTGKKTAESAKRRTTQSVKKSGGKSKDKIGKSTK